MKNKHIKSFLAFAVILALLISPVAADTTFVYRAPGEVEQSEALQKIEMIMDIIKDDYFKDVKEEDLINGAIKGMFETLDPHSTYFTVEEYEEFMNDINGEIVGIGIQIEKRDNSITIVAPIDGTPAYKAGLMTGDIITEVDGTDISGYTADQAAKLIRGEIGTKVKIGIKRAGEKDVIFYEFIRETIEINPVKYEIKEENIGYIRISEFSGKSYGKMKNAVNEFINKGVKGVIIDLRSNPGGLLDEVVDICRLLVPKGPIVNIQCKGEILETYSSDLESAPFKLAVLTNKGSASASEIMAGAIKDSKSGIIIGEKTYGKGTIQNIMRVAGGGGAKLTVANYLTRNGLSIDGIGIVPDIEVVSEIAAKAAEYAIIKGDRSIKSGMVGIDVLGVQQRLAALGYDAGKPDGIFGQTTKKAVLAFQEDNGLAKDALMDEDDLKILAAKLEEKIAKCDPQLDRAMEELHKMLGY